MNEAVNFLLILALLLLIVRVAIEMFYAWVNRIGVKADQVIAKLEDEQRLLDLVLQKREEIQRMIDDAAGKGVKIQFGVPRIVDMMPESPLKEGQ